MNTPKERAELAKELRRKIIEVMSINGGHLASNLGIVELSIALHQVFNSPKDKFIFDVSHQSYPHKLLTGREDKFHTIRKYKGLSGFCNPHESEHDQFFAGHAGTALSLALGMAHTRDLSAENNYHVIPIIGDATLTCGLTLEALNNVPKDLSNFILVLNDNEMAISDNVGAITNILSRVINHPTSNKIYQEVENFLSKVPKMGETLSRHGHKLKESVKNMVSTAPFFEQFNLSYVGPVDGHDTEKLIDLFQAVKNLKGPIIVHALTVKGKGMNTATENPVIWHGCKPFDIDSEKFLPAKQTAPTFPKIFGKEILEMAEGDESIITVTPAMPAGSCITPFMKQFPERCIDVGIAEGHAVTFCGGLGKTGEKKVVCSIYATFLQRALDNLFHDVCLQEIPVVFAIDRGGFSPADGSTHHGIYDIGFLSAMPNMVIAQPRDGHVLRELLRSAFGWKKPTAIRYPNMPTTDSSEPLKKRALGKAEILVEGEKLLIIALGHMCTTAMQVREELQTKGIHATVLDPVFIKPLDRELLNKLLMTHTHVVTIEEHSLQCGLGSLINNFVIRGGYKDVNVINFGVPEVYVEQGTHKDLIKEVGLDVETITEQIADALQPAGTSS